MSVSRPTPRTTITSSSSTNTWPVVTTTAIQVVPETTGSTTVGDGSQAFPTAAIVIIAVLCGAVVFFVAYKVYVWDYRRRHPYGEPPPEARFVAGSQSPAFGPSSVLAPAAFKSAPSGVLGDTHWASARRASTLGLAGMSSSSRPGSTLMMLDGTDDNKEMLLNGDDDVSPLASGMTSPISSPGGGIGSSSNSLNNQVMSTAPSRASLSSARRSLPPLRTMASSNRLSGAPHAPHSRIDIVPPSPLAPPPGTVVATDKAKLDFAPSSGIGEVESPAEWFDPSVAAATAPSAGHNFPPGGIGGARPAVPGTSRRYGGGSVSTSSSAGSPHRHSPSPVPGPNYQQQPRTGQQHYQQQQQQRLGSDSPPRSYTPRSTHTHSSSSQSSVSIPNSRALPPPAPIQTGGANPFVAASAANPTSPLEQLQQRFAQEAAAQYTPRE